MRLALNAARKDLLRRLADPLALALWIGLFILWETERGGRSPGMLIGTPAGIRL